jgi:hypothetical protein
MATEGQGCVIGFPKPQRGSGILAREQRRAALDAAEIEAKTAAKQLDGYRCQWPEKHKCRGGLEAAHIVDASLGGDMHPRNLVSLCAWIHRRGPESIHSKDLKVDGQRGSWKFYRKVWSETRAGEFTWRRIWAKE